MIIVVTRIQIITIITRVITIIMIMIIHNRKIRTAVTAAAK